MHWEALIFKDLLRFKTVLAPFAADVRYCMAFYGEIGAQFAIAAAFYICTRGVGNNDEGNKEFYVNIMMTFFVISKLCAWRIQSQ